MHDKFRAYLRGLVFEEIIKVLLERNYYTVILPDYVKTKECYKLGSVVKLPGNQQVEMYLSR